MDAVLLCLSLALSIALPHCVVRWDSRRLRPHRRQWVWNAASHWSAIVAFNWIAVSVHFARTRRSWMGLALGLLVAGLGVALQSGVITAVAWLLR